MDKNKSNNSNKEKLKTLGLILLIVILAAAIVLCVVIINKNNSENKEKELPYTELIQEITNKNVEKLEMTVGSTTVKVTLKGMAEGEEKTTIVPNTEVFVELVQAQSLEGNEIQLVQNPRSMLSMLPSYFFSLLPTFIMLALFIMVFKMQGIGDKGEIYDETERKIKTTFGLHIPNWQESLKDCIKLLNID